MDIPVKSQVTVVSSYTTDRILLESGECREQRGGPALYITSVLQKERIPHGVVTGQEFEVEIRISDQEAVVKLDFAKHPQEIPCPLDAEFLIISPIAKEWPLVDSHYQGKICVDIQGYALLDEAVKGGEYVPLPTEFAPFALKANADEVTMLPQDFLESQKSRILLVTNGRMGTELHWRGERFYFLPPFVADVPDAVGAGDSFLGFYTAALCHSLDPATAARYATDRVAEWLLLSKL